MQVSSLFPEAGCEDRRDSQEGTGMKEEFFSSPPHFINTKDLDVSILYSAAIYEVPTM